MKVVLSARIEADMAHQFSYGIAVHGRKTAEHTFARLDSFLNSFLSRYPRSGKKLPNGELYECWISRTPFVVIYRVDDESETITVLALFHHAQERTAFEADER